MANFDLSTYVDVQTRITRFWAEYPAGAIRTNLMSDPGDFTICRYVAKVYKDQTDPEPAATGWAFEIAGKGMANQTSHEENAETSAIGRALANLGFATKGEDRPSREEMSKVQRGNGEARPQPKSNYQPRGPEGAPAPTNITAKADKIVTPMNTLHGLADLRGLLLAEGTDRHAPLRSVCQFILPKIRAENGVGYVAWTSMSQLSDTHLKYLQKQIEQTDDNELMLMAVDYPAAIAAAQSFETIEQIRTNLASIGAKDHTHPDLLAAIQERKAALSPTPAKRVPGAEAAA